jgi:hypothetical protein
MTKRVLPWCLCVSLGLSAAIACDNKKQTEKSDPGAQASAAASAAEAPEAAIDKMTLPSDFPQMKIPRTIRRARPRSLWDISSSSTSACPWMGPVPATAAT